MSKPSKPSSPAAAPSLARIGSGPIIGAAAGITAASGQPVQYP